jgi:hypothetical protein
MVRTCRSVLAVAGLLGKAAVGLVGVMIVIGAVVPVPWTDPQARSGQVDPARAAGTVVLTVPEGRPAGTLTVVDASGRELATLTHWRNQNIAVLATRRDGARVSCFLKAQGSAVLLLAGAKRQTRIELEPDGATRACLSDICRGWVEADKDEYDKIFTNCTGAETSVASESRKAR